MPTLLPQDDALDQWVQTVTGADAVKPVALVQELWSGYGQIIRYQLQGEHISLPGNGHSVIVKRVNPPSEANHPRGWNTSISHQRKLRSYQVEALWYQHWAHQCPARVAKCLAMSSTGDQSSFILEDLNASGFDGRYDQPGPEAFNACIEWLATLHGFFMQTPARGLWPVGSYWHLATRPDEHQAMANGALKASAHLIDQALNQATYQTIIHGDAKVANFCFGNTDSGAQVAAVDFQYVGGGCGMKDLAYFVGSVLNGQQCQRQEQGILALYFSRLKRALVQYHPEINSDHVETEWRRLYPLAWADFERFLLGWMPGHRKLNAYSAAMTEQALALL